MSRVPWSSSASPCCPDIRDIEYEHVPRMSRYACLVSVFCGADLQVCGRPPGRPCWNRQERDVDVPRRPGGLPHKTTDAREPEPNLSPGCTSDSPDYSANRSASPAEPVSRSRSTPYTQGLAETQHLKP